ncbi:hypothetical protein AB6D20_027770 (plasmid) [Vibrio splendidus]
MAEMAKQMSESGMSESGIGVEGVEDLLAALSGLTGSALWTAKNKKNSSQKQKKFVNQGQSRPAKTREIPIHYQYTDESGMRAALKKH